MSEQEVTFPTMRFHKSSGLNSQVRLEGTQRSRKQHAKGFQLKGRNVDK
uniref:Uncharacterized protein n=1 Tax=Mus spicilegus TaxID=10103 RepID=A0A8C6GFI9_MUSSI